MMDLVLAAPAMFDGTDVRRDTAVGVQDGRIAWIGPRADAPEAATVVESGGTLLPGLIDLHFHHFLLMDHNPPSTAKDVSLDRQPLVAVKIFKAAWAARTWLESGVTTVRDAGAPEYLAVAIREAIEEGWTPGPRVFASGPLIAQHGGIRLGNENMVEEVTGEDEARKCARLQLKAGVDVLKIYGASSIGGGGGRLIGPPGWPQLSEPEMRAIVEEGHKAGRLVSAHAVSAESIKNAVRAGVDWVDHADFLDDEAIELLLEHDTPVVPTQSIAWSLFTYGEEMGFGKYLPVKAKEVFDQAHDGLVRAWKSGVRMAAGTDADNPRASISKECELFTDIGMTPIEALRAATSVAATVLGRDDQFGSIAVGKLADLVLVNGNPTEVITELDTIHTVVQSGKIVHTAATDEALKNGAAR
jgi:imidazolonepropionase-like amidohydrolase